MTKSVDDSKINAAVKTAKEFVYDPVKGTLGLK